MCEKRAGQYRTEQRRIGSRRLELRFLEKLLKAFAKPGRQDGPYQFFVHTARPLQLSSHILSFFNF